METAHDEHAPPAPRPTDVPLEAPAHEDTTPQAQPHPAQPQPQPQSQPQPQPARTTRMPAPGPISMPAPGPHPALAADPPLATTALSITVPSPTGGATPYAYGSAAGAGPSQGGTPEDERPPPPPPRDDRPASQLLQPPTPAQGHPLPLPRDAHDLRAPLASNLSFHGHGAPRDSGYEGSTIRRPARTLSHHDARSYQDGRQSRRPTNGSVGVGVGVDNLGPPSVAREGMASRRSVVDWVVPHANGGHDPGYGAPPVVSIQDLMREKTVGERLEPTLEHAKRELKDANVKARASGWALNAAIGAQVLLGALTTGVAAATTGRQTSIATSVLGGMSTLAASYLARARGSGEPEHSALRCRDLENFIRDLEAFMLDKGHLVGSEYDPMIERYRRRFEEVLGNNSTGVGDTVAENQKPPRRSGETQMSHLDTKTREKLSEKHPV